ncbi:Arginine transport ATP-binding protein ArtM [bacterium HR30]|nr:Arginine transport ATP-binding protein ArtM [bacterium HR30]
MPVPAACSAPSTVFVESDNLGKRFGHHWALRGANIRIRAGETVVVIGPNGAGKSTLLKLFATAWKPTEGMLRLFGRLVSEDAPFIRQQIGYVVHTSLLYPQLTVRENLAFYARLYRTAGAAERVEELSKRLGLVGWGARPVRGLSRGLEQRAALARALLHRPPLLLLDEPLTGLDPEATEEVLRLIAELQETGVTVVLSTHDFAKAEAVGRRVLCLRAGRVVYDGPMIRPLAEAYRAWMQPDPESLGNAACGNS